MGDLSAKAKETNRLKQQNDRLLLNAPVSLNGSNSPRFSSEEQEHASEAKLADAVAEAPEAAFLPFSYEEMMSNQESFHQLEPASTSPFPETVSVETRHTKRKLSLFPLVVVALLALFNSALVFSLLSQPDPRPLLHRANPLSTLASVGFLTFHSSGQLDPTSSKGLNDGVTVSLHHLSVPLVGDDDEVWLLPDATDPTTRPLFLGKLSISDGQARLTYVHPDHEDLLTIYSAVVVAETPNEQVLLPDRKTWRFVGSIPRRPTPGDEQHYSLLDHLRHLLAKDPTLQQIGLQGGLDIWLYRNTEKILEWSSAARDSWAGGKQTELIHRQMIRVMDYLDGAASVTSDLPAGTPLLVDPQQGRIGLLERSQTQALPAYLSHVALHLQGLSNAPDHTEAQQQLATKLDAVLKQVASDLQKVHQDAVTLVRMTTVQLKSSNALDLLDDLVTNAISAYAGQLDPKTNETINGITWLHDEISQLAVIALSPEHMG